MQNVINYNSIYNERQPMLANALPMMKNILNSKNCRIVFYCNA